MKDKLKVLVNVPVSLLKGLRVTMTNMARSKATVRYPEVMPSPAGQSPSPVGDDPFLRPYEMAPRFRGLHGLTKDPVTGDLNCIGCMACAKVCPDDLISMDLEKREGHNGRYPVTFNVNIGPCCFCGLCAEVCPTPMRAIVMSDLFEWAAYRRDGANLVLGKDDLERHGEIEVARRRAGREWSEEGKLTGVNPEEHVHAGRGGWLVGRGHEPSSAAGRAREPDVEQIPQRLRSAPAEARQALEPAVVGRELELLQRLDPELPVQARGQGLSDARQRGEQILRRDLAPQALEQRDAPAVTELGDQRGDALADRG